MSNRKEMLTAIVVAGSLGFGAQTIFAQGTGSRPLENPTSEGQFETKGSPTQQRSKDTSENRGATGGVSGSTESGVQRGTSGGTQPGSGTKGYESGSRTIERGASESQFETKGSDKPGRAASISEADIQKIKAALKAKGHTVGPMNGELDSQTQQALRDFQQKNNLRVTGTVDEQTAAKLGVTISPSASNRGSAGASSKTGGSMERGKSGSSSE